jgi:hypothetical protein
MKNFILIAATLFSITTLPAQAPPFPVISDFAKVEANAMAQMLTQSALAILIGVVVMLCALWLIIIVQSYNEMGKSTKRNQASAMLFLLFTFGVSGSGCSVEQRLRAADFQAAEAVENQPCTMNQHLSSHSNPMHNSYSSQYSYSAWYSPAFCKRCGKKMSNARF